MAEPIFRKPASESTLYFLEADFGSRCPEAYCVGFWPGVPLADTLLPLSRTWEMPTGIYLFLRTAAADLNIDGFVRNLAGLFKDPAYSRCRMVWIRNPADPFPRWSGEFLPLVMDRDASGRSVGRVSAATSLNLSPSFWLSIPRGCVLDLDSSTEGIALSLPAGSGDFSFHSRHHPTGVTGIGRQILLSLAGENTGCLGFDLTLAPGTAATALDILEPGLRIFFQEVSTRGRTAVRAVRYPVFAPGSVPQRFNVRLDPICALNPHRSHFQFRLTGRSRGDPLPSHFRTRLGRRVTLTPMTPADPEAMPRLVFEKAASDLGDTESEEVYLAPSGEFLLGRATDDGEALKGDERLLCGFSGTETLLIPARFDTVLRFVPGHPAFVPNFPLQTASPVGPPIDPDAGRLTKRATTPWVQVFTTTSGGRDPTRPIRYSAQPDLAPLYRREATAGVSPAPLLGWASADLLMPAESGVCFPLVPYGGLVLADPPRGLTAGQISEMERRIIAPSRRHAIADAAARAAPEGATDLVTPAGFTIGIRTDGSWDKIQLGRGGDGEPFGMAAVPFALQQALQTSQLFLVAANDCHLGKFQSTVTIDGWQLEIAVGKHNRYNDYRNLLIFKFRSGALEDLVTHPELWTRPADFAAPTTLVQDPEDPSSEMLEGPDASQLATLSSWLGRYIAAAKLRETDDDGHFSHFRKLVSDPAWTGVLALNVTVGDLPGQLQGLMAGIDADRFRAHHVGIAFNAVDSAALSIRGPSDWFGLIDYRDAGLPPEDPGAPGLDPIPPDPGRTFDFKVLTLQARFAHSALKSFQSRAQLTLNAFLGEPLARSADTARAFPAIVLNVSLQRQGDQRLFVLEGDRKTTLIFDSSVLNRAEITGARFSTVAQGIPRFDFTGFLDFKVLAAAPADGGDPGPMDLFSFGGDGPTDRPRQGLAFANLGLVRDGPEAVDDGYRFDGAGVAFDTERSTCRASGLYAHFALQADGLLAGDGRTRPEDLGYFPVDAGPLIAGVTDTWHGLRFRLNLGSPGEMAGKVNLNAFLLLAWSPGLTADSDAYRVQVGLKLPGAGPDGGLLDLQGVVKLAVGDMRLVYVREQQSFLLVLHQIALRFMGLLKLPPSGDTDFYLFGNPKSGGRASGLGWYAVYRKKTEAT